jgi:uncharacterized delta-60 repeat protein
LCLFGGVIARAQSQQVFLHDPNGNLQGLVSSSNSSPPAITAAPSQALGQLGGSASFSVMATGTQPLEYRWRRNGADLPGATGDTLRLMNLGNPDFADYTVVISNLFGGVTSAPPATLYLDSNNNGLPDVWEMTYFGSLTNSAYSDSDGDGVSNMQEFLDGTNPTNSASHFFTLTVNEGVEVQPRLDRYPPGTPITLTALPVTGLSFCEWSGAFSSGHNPTTLTINSNITVTALRSNRGLDPAWTPSFTWDDGFVFDFLIQPDDKVVVAGRFSDINGLPARGLIRLNADGSLDKDFLTALGLGPSDNSNIYRIVRQPDGKIVIVGDFTSVDDQPRNRVARLNPDGSLDTGFDPGGGPESTVFTAAVLSDGRIVLGGQFFRVSGVVSPHIAMLRSDGSIDTTFAITNGFNSDIYDLAVQSGDRLLVGGNFTQFENQSANHLVRLTTNGLLDASFNPGGEGPNDWVQRTAELPDGHLFCVGQFNQYNSTPGRAVLLDANGLPSPAFTNTFALNNRIMSFAPDPTGGFIVGGFFNFFGDTPAQYLARFKSDGSLDSSFSTTNAANRPVWAVARQNNGVLFVGGQFSTWGSSFQERLVALNSTNAAPLTNPPLHAALRAQVAQILLQPDGTLLAAGNFLTVSGKPSGYLARITPSGLLDNSFNLTNGPNSTVLSLARQTNGSYLAGGSFNYCGNYPANHLARFLTDGSYDTSFDIGSGFDGAVYAILVQPDGRILAGGNFAHMQGLERPGLVRVLSNGQRDDTFVASVSLSSSTFLSGAVYALAWQPDNKILIGGEFTSVLGVSRVRVARLWPDGQVDTTFDPGTGIDGTIQAVAIQPDGKILIGGNFNIVNGVRRRHIARLMPNGSPDLSFGYDNSGVGGIVWQISLQSDNSIYLVGDFSEANGNNQNRCAHFFADGSLDPDFNPGTELNDGVYSLAAAADGSVYLSGWIKQMYDQPRAGALRLVTSPAFHVQFVGTKPAGPNLAPNQPVQLAASAQSAAGLINGVRFEISSDGLVFSPVAEAFLDQTSQWTGSWLPQAAGNYYLRAVATDSAAQEQASTSFGPLMVTNGQSSQSYSAWVAANFSPADQANIAVSGPQADPDGDGAPNLMEYAMGTSPNSFSSVPLVVGGIWPASGSPQYPTLSYRQNLAATDVHFIVQVSTDMVVWSDGPSFTTLVNTIQNGDNTQTVQERSNQPIGSASTQFLRLKLVSP